MTNRTSIDCVPLISGVASGELLVSETGLSFWGGVDPVTGCVIDQHHPLHTQCLAGKILAMPSGRGSCSGSGAMLECLLNKVAPSALVFTEPDDILVLGVLAGQVLFEQSIPVYRITPSDFGRLESGMNATVGNEGLILSLTQSLQTERVDYTDKQPLAVNTDTTLQLSSTDNEFLQGRHGKATQLAMQIVVRMAELQGAEQLIDVSQAHIDACVYNGPSSLMFAERLASLGGRVKVPTTLNSLSVDKRRWSEQGVDTGFGTAASALGDAYMAMGATLSYTCAPYLLDSAPAYGEQIVWAESNAVTFANSIIGARTQKYPDFLDICIALTGRAPMTGAHLDDGRQPTVKIHVALDNAGLDNSEPSATKQAVLAESPDDAFWPLLGYHIGSISRNDIPLVTGLENLTPSTDDHKAFSAAFATTSSVPIYHIYGHTPEATSMAELVGNKLDDQSVLVVDSKALLQSFHELNTATSQQVDLICLGNPHFSLTECAALAALCAGRTRSPAVGVIVTMGRHTCEQATEAGYIAALEAFGVQIINDTCWCMIEEPIIPKDAKVLMTNSGKYAHYGPGLVDRPVHFAGLQQCVDAACSGRHESLVPDWLR